MKIVIPIGQLCLLLFSITLIIPARTFSQNEEEIFEQVFGKKKNSEDQTIPVPLIVDGQPSENILITITSDPDESRVESAQFIKHLVDRISPASLRSLKEAVDGEGYLTFADVQEIGFRPFFDQQKIELHVAIPPELLKRHVISLQTAFTYDEEIVVQPLNMSAYLSINSDIDFYYRDGPETPSIGLPVQIGLESAMNIYKWVLEGSASIKPWDNTPWEFHYARLVRDWPQAQMRFTLGDVLFATRSFQNHPSLKGIALMRTNELSPSISHTSQVGIDLNLKEWARVDVIVNGRTIRSNFLNAGPYRFEDIALSRGANQVELKLTDKTGLIDTHEFFIPFHTDLLPRGEFDFAYALGVPDFQLAFPTITGFHRFGVTHTFTLGVNFQGNLNQQLIGIEALLATGLGSFRLDTGLSQVSDLGYGGGAQLGYELLGSLFGMDSSFYFSAAYKQQRFTNLGEAAPDNKFLLDFTFRVNQELPLGMSLWIDGSFRIARDREMDEFEGSIGLKTNLSLAEDVTMDVGVNAVYPPRSQKTWQGNMILDAMHSKTESYVSFQQDLADQTSRFDFHYRPQHRAREMAFHIGSQMFPIESGKGTNLYGRFEYRGQRFESTLRHRTVLPGMDKTNYTHSTNLHLGTCFILTKNGIDLSRPVQDSFAVVTAHPLLKGLKIGVNPVANQSLVQIDYFNAIIPNIDSYRYFNVSVEIPDLPLEYELIQSDFVILPTYHSGTTIRIDTLRSLSVVGTLHFADGTPVVLQSGEAILLDDPDWAPVLFFTDRSGVFRIYQLKPGKYTLKMFFNENAVLFMEIPHTASQVYDLGSMTLPQSIKVGGEK